MTPWCPQGPRTNQATSPQRSPLSELTGSGCRTWLGLGSEVPKDRNRTRPGGGSALQASTERLARAGRWGNRPQGRGQGPFPEGRTPGWEMRREAAADGVCPGPGCLNPSGERGTRSRAPMPLPYAGGLAKPSIGRACAPAPPPQRALGRSSAHGTGTAAPPSRPSAERGEGRRLVSCPGRRATPECHGAGLPGAKSGA